MKACSKCGEVKPHGDFYRDKRKRDGLYPHCKTCHAELTKAWKVANSERVNRAARALRAANPEKHREAQKRSRAKHPETAKRYRAENRERRRLYLAEWVERNRERYLAYQRAYYAANVEQGRARCARRDALRRGAPIIERVDRALVYDRDAGICHICGGKVPKDAFTLDHLVPLSKGGEHTMRNVRVAHRGCNSRRKDGRLPAQLLLVG